MKIFAISDLHLSFTSNKPMSVFGPQWENHAARLQAAWLERVGPEDVILIPGDISWALRAQEATTDLNWLNQLPGRKICIRGNHDYWWDRPGKLNQQYDKITFLQNDAVLLGNLAICGTRGWEYRMLTDDDEACKKQQHLLKREIIRLQLSLDAALKKGATEIWVMLHYPPAYYGAVPSPFTTLMKGYPVTKVLYGHLHGQDNWALAIQKDIGPCCYYLVSADFLDFKPILLDERTISV